MLYLLSLLGNEFLPFRLFEYVTFRAGGAIPDQAERHHQRQKHAEQSFHRTPPFHYLAKNAMEIAVNLSLPVFII